MPGPRMPIKAKRSNSSKGGKKLSHSHTADFPVDEPVRYDANASPMRSSGGKVDRPEVLEDLDSHAEELRSIMSHTPKKALSFEEQNRGRAVSMNELHSINEFTYTRYYQQHKEVICKWILTVSRGISGKVKILEYDLKDLVRCGGIYTLGLDGTILTMDLSASFFVFFVLASFCFIVLIVFAIVDGGYEIETESLEKISVSLNQVVPFVLGSYVALALQRWWTLRYNGLGEVFNAIVNLQMVVACVMHPERLRPVRTLIMKWGFASIFLLMKAVRGNPSLTDMLYKCLLSEAELQILEEVDDLRGRPEVLWSWILRLCHESFNDACGPMPYSIQLNKISEICMQASNGINLIDIHLNTPLPFVYVHLITMLVDINTMFFIGKSAVFTAVAYRAGDYTRLFCEILQCMLVPTLYRGLLSVASQIFDPFGDDVLDYPIGSIMDWAATCCEDVFLAQERFPGVPASVFEGAKKRLSTERLKPSEEDPQKFASLRDRFRGILLRAFRSGKLDEAMLKTIEKNKNPDAAALDAGPDEVLNAKSIAAMSAATVFSVPIANEVCQFGKSMRGGLVVLRHQVVMLHKAVAEAAAKQHEEFETAADVMENMIYLQSQESDLNRALPDA